MLRTLNLAAVRDNKSETIGILNDESRSERRHIELILAETHVELFTFIVCPQRHTRGEAC